MSTKPIKIQAARTALLRAGFVCVRTSGKHAVWRHPDGRSLSLPYTPTRGEIRGFLAHKVRTYAAGRNLIYHRTG